MERETSYSELAMLTSMFEKQCKERSIVWIDEEAKDDAFLDFCGQWTEGEDNPEILLGDYGYEIRHNI